MSPRADLKLNIVGLIVSILGIAGGSTFIYLTAKYNVPTIAKNFFIAGIVVSVILLLLSVWSILVLTYTIKEKGEYY